MTTTAGPDNKCAATPVYQVRLHGHLNPRWADRFQQMTFDLGADGTTTLTGQLIDQAALHGVLAQLRDLGIPILSIQQLCSLREGTAHHD